MTRLYGFQCNHCGVKSKDHHGYWYQVQGMNVRGDEVSYNFGINHLMSDGSHYCSVGCLVKDTEGWKTR